jgi:hypothetical protein
MITEMIQTLCVKNCCMAHVQVYNRMCEYTNNDPDNICKIIHGQLNMAWKMKKNVNQIHVHKR